MTLLDIATTLRSLPAITLLLKYLYKTDAVSALPSIHIAAAKNHTDCLQLLASTESAVHSIDQCLNTPLHYAVERGCLESTKILMEKGANFLQKNNKDSTPLSIASIHNHDTIVAFMLKTLPISIDATLRFALLTAFSEAITHNHSQVVQRFLSAPIFQTDFHLLLSESNLFNIALEHNKDTILDLLLKHPFLHPPTPLTNFTLSHRAAEFNQDRMVRLLFHHGCSLTEPDMNGDTPFLIALKI